MKYLLTIDVGNTHIKMQLMDRDISAGTFRLTTKQPRTSDEYGICIREFLGTYGVNKEDIIDTVISSVVPKINYSLNSAVIKFIGKEPLFISSRIKTGIQIRTENAKEVGADRIVDVAAVWHTYHRDCIIVDFGTATTFDYVSREGVFAYTVIVPGIQISANALTGQTAKLPEIEILKPESVLGTNTVTGMQAGVVYGYIGAVEYIIDTMKKELHLDDCLVIATGGLGKIIAGETDRIDIYDKDIAGKGISILYHLNRE